MIQYISVINDEGNEMIFPIFGQGVNNNKGIYLSKADGLTPPSATINTTTLSLLDGSTYNSAVLDDRNIVLTFLTEISDEYTIEENRLRLYDFFTVKKRVGITVQTDVRQYYIEGYVESNEPDIFSELQETEVSIICPNPYFTLGGQTEIIFSGAVDMFEFPFSNESLDENLIIMSEIRENATMVIDYQGDADTGITFYIHALGEIKGLYLYEINTRTIIQVDDEKLKSIMGSYIQQGDDLIINSVPGNYYFHLIRNGVTYNVLNALTLTSQWITLVKGPNRIAYTVTYGLTNVEFRVYYDTYYLGV